MTHDHYHKDISHLKAIDVYRILDLYGVTQPALQHAIKKLLCAGKRGAQMRINQERSAKVYPHRLYTPTGTGNYREFSDNARRGC